jgi:hypothetical protein
MLEPEAANGVDSCRQGRQRYDVRRGHRAAGHAGHQQGGYAVSYL